MKKFLFIFVILAVSSNFTNSFADSYLSRDTIFTKSINDATFQSFSPKDYTTRDTGINDIHVYQPFLLSGYSNFFLGNIGLAGTNYALKPDKNIGFKFINDPFDVYLIKSSDVKYYNSVKPFTQANYILGSKKEQDIDVLHTQNINRRVNIGFRYRRMGSDGFFSRQNTSINNVVLFGSANNKANNYHSLYNIIYNKLKAYENYGLYNDTDFFNSGFSNKALLQVNSDAAQNSRGLRGVYTKQCYDFGKVSIAEQTDSLHPGRKEYSYRLFATGNIAQSWRLFSDSNPDTLLDRHYYKDSSFTKDSSFIGKNTFALGWQTLGLKQNGNERTIQLSIQYKVEVSELYNFYFLSGSKKSKYYSGYVNENHIASIALKNAHPEKLSYSFESDYVLAGYNKGNLHLDGSLTYILNKFSDNTSTKSALNFNVYFLNQSPDYFYRTFQNNYFKWNNDTLLNPATTRISFAYLNNAVKLNARVSYYLLDNFIYIFSDTLPHQQTHTRDMLQVEFYKDFKLKSLHIVPRAIFQSGSLKRVVLPQLITRSSIYIEKSIFKKAAFAQFGIDVSYSSAVFGYAYEPSFGQFFVQRNFRTGDYPYIDYFMNFKISSFRIFFKVEHLNAGLMGNAYYNFQKYPMHDRAFKMGIIWVFNN